MFIIFLPIMLMALALIVDIGLMYGAKIKGNELLKTTEKENLDIIDYFKINNIDITKIEKTKKNNKDCVIINYNIESIFGTLLGFKQYDIEIDNCK